MKINKLPGRFIHYMDLKQRKVWKEVVVHEDIVVARVGKNSWTLIPCYPYFVDDISGCIGGYNIDALKAAYALVNHGFWSSEDAKAFCSWWHTEDQRSIKDRKIREAKEILKEEGYRIEKDTSSR